MWKRKKHGESAGSMYRYVLQYFHTHTTLHIGEAQLEVYHDRTFMRCKSKSNTN